MLNRIQSGNRAFQYNLDINRQSRRCLNSNQAGSLMSAPAIPFRGNETFISINSVPEEIKTMSNEAVVELLDRSLQKDKNRNFAFRYQSMEDGSVYDIKIMSNPYSMNLRATITMENRSKPEDFSMITIFKSGKVNVMDGRRRSDEELDNIFRTSATAVGVCSGEYVPKKPLSTSERESLELLTDMTLGVMERTLFLK